MGSFKNPTTFAGAIWLDDTGAFTYECRFCEKKSIFAKSIEVHILHEHQNELRPKHTIPSENQRLWPRKTDEHRYHRVSNTAVRNEPPSLSLPPPVLPRSLSLSSHSHLYSRSQSTVSTKSASDSIGHVRYDSCRSNQPVDSHAPSKRMKLNNSTPTNAAAEHRKANSSSYNQHHQARNNHGRTLATAPAPTSTSSSKSSSSSTSVRDRVFFGSRHSGPVQTHLPNKRTVLSGCTPVHSVEKCSTCNQRFNDLNSLEMHAQQCHKLACIYCQTVQPKPFKTEHGYWNHLRVQHAVIFKYQCRVCVHAFKNEEEFDDHMMNAVHSNRNKIVKCQYCLRTFSSFFHKNEHVKASHKNLQLKKQQ